MRCSPVVTLAGKMVISTSEWPASPRSILMLPEKWAKAPARLPPPALPIEKRMFEPAWLMV